MPDTINFEPDLSDDFINFVKEAEGFKSNAYSDYGHLSIGYGTEAKSRNETIDRATAEQRLHEELSQHANNIDEALTKTPVKFTPRQREALISFDFNTGSGAEVAQSGDWNVVARNMAQYTHAGGQQLRGLVNRRNAELRYAGGGEMGGGDDIPDRESKTEPTGQIDFEPDTGPSRMPTFWESITAPHAEQAGGYTSFKGQSWQSNAWSKLQRGDFLGALNLTDQAARKAIGLPSNRAITYQEAKQAVEQFGEDAIAEFFKPNVPINRPLPDEQPTVIGKLRAVGENALADSVGFMTSEGGVMSLGIGALPIMAQAIIAAGFGSQIFTQSLQAFNEGRYQDAMEDFLFGVLGAHGARESIKTNSIPRTFAPEEPLAQREMPGERGFVLQKEPSDLVRQFNEAQIKKEEARDAKQRSDAQVQAGETTQRDQAGTEGEVTQPSDSDNVIGEAEGTAGGIPQEGEEVRSQQAGLEPTNIIQFEPDTTTEEPAPEAAAMGGPGTPAATEISKPRVTGIKNRIIDDERMKRGWLPLMQPARQAMGEVWDKAMDVVERDEQAGSNMIDSIRDGTKTDVSEVDHGVLAHERIRLMNERDMEAERASDPYMSEQERDEAHARWATLEDRINEADIALKQAGTITARALQFRQGLIADDYTFAGMERKTRAIKKRPLTLEESDQIRKESEQLDKVETGIKKGEERRVEAQADENGELELKATKTRVSKSKAPKDLNAQHQKLIDAIREHMQDGGELKELKPLIAKLAENYVRKGITKLQTLSRALHESLKPIMPGITEAQVRDLFSGYGDFRPLSKDQIKVMLRDLKGQAQQAGKLRDMAGKIPPKKTGPERRTPTAKERKLIKLVNEMKKKGGFVVTHPARQLKSALAAVKTRLRNQIVDLTRQLTTGEKPPGKDQVEYDLETEKLLTLRNNIRQTLKDISNGPTDQQRLKAAISAAKRNVEYWENRLKLAKKGIFKIDRETGKPVTNNQLEALKAQIKASKSEVGELYRLANPYKSAEAKALASYQTRLFKQMADLQDRLAREDYSPRPRKRIQLDPETEALVAQRDRMREKFDQGLMRQRLENRTTWEKALDGISKWRRAFVLSWPTVLGKLTAASTALIAETPVEEGVRTGLRAVLPGVAERAPRFGRGFHLKTEAKAITHTFRTLFKAAGQKWKTGQSDIDRAYGDPRRLPIELKDFISNLHAMLKEPARQNEFFRSLETRLAHAGKHGVDITDPLVQTKISKQALQDAQAQIFMENNMVADAINRGLSRLRQANKTTGLPTVSGKLTETAIRYGMPIVKIPLNLIKRTFEYSFGTATGSVRLAHALIKGLDNVPPESHDIIMRNLSRGLIGQALIAYGYFHKDQFGGYYQRGEKRDPSDLAAGHARFFGLDIPPYLIHSPVLAQLQIGSTIRRIVDSKLRKKDLDNQSYGRAIMGAYAGVVEDAPLVRITQDNLKLFNPTQRDQFMGEWMRSTVPGAVEWTAQHFDKDSSGEPIKRKPKTAVDYFKQAIPGLRQQVPEKIDKASSSAFSKAF